MGSPVSFQVELAGWFGIEEVVQISSYVKNRGFPGGSPQILYAAGDDDEDEDEEKLSE